VYRSDISNPGEDWSWMTAFFMDFPVSIGIHEILRFAEENTLIKNSAFGLLLIHTVVGGMWWFGIAFGLRKIFWRR